MASERDGVDFLQLGPVASSEGIFLQCVCRRVQRRFGLNGSRRPGTHFWGPVSLVAVVSSRPFLYFVYLQVANWGLPIAALSDLRNKDEEYISGTMTTALACYS